jgi:hypothetical protein
MKILVCGGRAYRDHARVFDVLDALDRRRPIKTLIQGGADGAEAIAREWAENRRVKVQIYASPMGLADEDAWTTQNQRMLASSRPALVVAFPGARRTADLVQRAKAAGITVLEIE